MTTESAAATYTPGPWRVHVRFRSNVIMADTMGQVATVGEAADPDASADARLIAAAPDLLRIVQQLQMWLDAGGVLPTRSTLMDDDDVETIEEAIDAAIAKATNHES